VGLATAISLVSVGIDITPLLAFGSVSSLVVGFAAQSTIGNFVSAMALVSWGAGGHWGWLGMEFLQFLWVKFE
jgi:small-conductance mechanosensitive channel